MWYGEIINKSSVKKLRSADHDGNGVCCPGCDREDSQPTGGSEEKYEYEVNIQSTITRNIASKISNATSISRETVRRIPIIPATTGLQI